MFEKKKHLMNQLDTIVDPQNKHTIVDQGCSWTTPLKNCLCCFFNWVLKWHSIFWEIGHFWKFEVKETKKVKEESFSKGKGKGNVWKKTTHLRKQLDTIVDPQNKHTIVDQGWSWTTPLRNCVDAVFLILFFFFKASYILDNWAFLGISNERN